ncbi:unnamed protein product, partial [Ilex paraguariensis]
LALIDSWGLSVDKVHERTLGTIGDHLGRLKKMFKARRRLGTLIQMTLRSMRVVLEMVIMVEPKIQPEMLFLVRITSQGYHRSLSVFFSSQ